MVGHVRTEADTTDVDTVEHVSKEVDRESKDNETPPPCTNDTFVHVRTDTETDGVTIHVLHVITDAFKFEHVTVFKKDRDVFTKHVLYTTFVFSVLIDAFVHEKLVRLLDNVFSCDCTSNDTFARQAKVEEEIVLSVDTLQFVKYEFEAEKFTILSMLV